MYFKWHILPSTSVSVIHAPLGMDRNDNLPFFLRDKLRLHRHQQQLKSLLLEKENLPETLRYDPHGRPYLTPGHHISLSHSGEAAAMAVSAGARTGIDIQEFSPKVLHVLPRIASPQETETALRDETGQTAHYVWSAKEAVYKAAGIRGLSLRDDIRLDFYGGLPYRARVNENGREIRYRLYPYRLNEYFLITAVEEKPEEIRLR